MSQPWFRFYHESLDDPKVQKLPGDAFKFWVNLLCLAKRNNGKIPELDAVSFAFRMPKEGVEIFMGIMKMAGLVDERANGLEPHNWKKRQPKSDSSTERVKQFRKRKCNVSSDVTDTLENQIQSREDTEQRREEGITASPPKPKRVRVGKTSAPESFPLTLEMRRLLTDEQITTNPEIETRKMLDHFRGNGEQKSDWTATWRNWMRNSMKFSSNGKGGSNGKHRETDEQKNNRALKAFVNRSVAPQMHADVPDVREDA